MAAENAQQAADRVLGSDAARAVGRFNPGGPDGYRSRSLPDGPLRATRAEAVADVAGWQDICRDAYAIDESDSRLVS